MVNPVEEHPFYENAADKLEYFNFHIARNNNTPAHFHSNMEIIFVKTGKVRASINGTEKTLVDGDIALSNGFDVHYYQGGINSEIYVLVFSSSYLLRNFAEGTALENFYPSSEISKEIFVLIDLFYNVIRPDTPELRSALVDAVIGLLLRIHPLKKIDKRGSADFHEILTFINESINEDISCESVAASFGFTKNYFSMLFNRYTGMHFRPFLNRIRYEKAQNELDKNPDEPITKIVFRCGFKSLNTYYRVVKAIKEGTD